MKRNATILLVLRRGRESGTPQKVTDVYPKSTDIYRNGVLPPPHTPHTHKTNLP